MANQKEDLGSFFKENVQLARDYFDTRMEIYRLRMIRLLSKSAGYFLWITISLFLVFLLFIFLGLILGIWLSDVTGSYLKGFSLATLVLLVFIIILAVLRKVLFVNPIIKTFIRHSGEPEEEES